ncbi:MAG: mechanosensitive ion channel [Thalassotalea sp.]|nr:mechanosensitive ion channel [Thalassotalea sp.]
MIAIISSWLTEQGVSSENLVMASLLVGCVIIFVISAAAYYLVKHKLLVAIQKLVSHSRNTWDDLIFEHHVFTRIALLIPIVIFWFLIPQFVIDEPLILNFLLVLAKVAITFQVARTIGALLNVINSLSKETAKDRYLPLNASIQVIKLVVYLVATILSISFVLDKSPIYLLSGLGALTAVLLLVFQDTIKGLVASIQISANKMLAPGDWIEIPQYGADGDVLEIGLNTVKVQNFDRTVTTVPTYALISGSFKNWRDMFASGGRRIKRTIIIDIGSIHFYQTEKIEKLSEIHLLKDYLATKKQEIAEHSQRLALEDTDYVNQRKLTNVGTFRAYITEFLQDHEKVHHQMTCMVRQLPATATGLPLELYFFSNDQNWVNYEAIQADIFDHLFAMAPVFDLRIFQHPSGDDWRKR